MKTFEELKAEFLNKQREKEIEKTGILGYCPCCGAQHRVNEEYDHDYGCIYYDVEVNFLSR